MKKTLLFVAYGGGHVNALLPIIRVLSKTPDYNIEVLGLTTAAATLEKEGVPCFGFRHLITEDDKSALFWGEKLAGGTNHQLVSSEETVAYLGLSYMDLINRHGEEEAQRLYATKGRQAFLPLSIMERLLESNRPDLIVATSAPRTEQAAILAAGKMGIKAVCIVDLLCTREVKWVGQKGYANKICVLADFVRELILKAGRSQDEVIVTGNPAFDALTQPDLNRKGGEFRTHRGWGTDLVILWASQIEPEKHPVTGAPGNPALPRQIESELFKIIQRHPKWRLVIRPHPNEPVPVNKLPERTELSLQTDDPSVLLKGVDVVVSMSSTLGLEGALIGKPLISLNMSLSATYIPFAKMGIAKGVDCLEDLEDGLLDVFEGRWKMTAKLPKVGGATHNVVQVINELLTSDKPY